MLGRRTAGWDDAARALPVLVVAVACLGAVAYAATGPASGGGGDAGAEPWQRPSGLDPRPGALPARPLITKHPKRMSTSSTASFAFRAPRGNPRFQCRLDGDGWRGCHAPFVLRGLEVGDHSFAVRAVGRNGRGGPAARFGWKLVKPKPFTIEPQLESLGALYPGAGPVMLPVVVRNPNPVPIFVTGLRVSVTADALGCDSATNLILAPADVSRAAPLRLPARGSASLPAADVLPPSIALRERPFNQDACQGAQFPLAFSGKAHG